MKRMFHSLDEEGEKSTARDRKWVEKEEKIEVEKWVENLQEKKGKKTDSENNFLLFFPF